MKKFAKISTIAMISTFVIGSSATIFAAEKTYQSNGMVTFEEDDSITDPVDPNKPDPNKPVRPWDPTTPDHKPQPGTKGPLSIDFASSIDFGVNKISNKDQTYYAEPQYLFAEGSETEKDPTSARPNYVQVTDKRGADTGWSLRVRQNHQFNNSLTTHKELTGAVIRFTNATPDSVQLGTDKPKAFDIVLDAENGANSTVMTAAKGAGLGTWVDRFGGLQEIDVNGKKVLKNTAISLSIPGVTAKDNVNYRTTLTWTLSDVPGN